MTTAFRGTHAAHKPYSLLIEPCLRQSHCNTRYALLLFQRNASTSSTSQRAAPSTASTSVHSVDPYDEVNPPTSSLPPALNLPARTPDSSSLGHVYRTGRAYGSFYWKGLKAAWSNHKECRPLRQDLLALKKQFAPQIKAGNSIPELALAMMELRLLTGIKSEHRLMIPPDASAKISGMTRARYIRLMREKEDWSKLPRFAFLVAICGEYLPLLIPFFPSISPNTCQIPSQVVATRKAKESRRKESLALYGQLYGQAKDVDGQKANIMDEDQAHQETQQRFEKKLESLGGYTESFEQVANQENVSPRLTELHTSCIATQHLHRASLVFSLHGKIWDRFGIAPPRWILERRVAARMKYLMVDDLLLRQSQKGTSVLSEDELKMACEDRAIPITDRPLEDLRQDLEIWMDVVFSQDQIYRFDLPALAPWSRFREVFADAQQRQTSWKEVAEKDMRPIDTL
ncbi:Hypothetical protein D9617_37g012580 [Elsinoe fawcettii]|nr:Hypothetical protein D9617_37g012580 [Elsinoe fawcettii]